MPHIFVEDPKIWGLSRVKSITPKIIGVHTQCYARSIRQICYTEMGEDSELKLIDIDNQANMAIDR